MNHVHIELNLRGAAKKTTFWDKNISYDTPTPAPVSTPAPQAPAQPAPQQQPQTHPWNGPGGGTQYDQTGGAWN
jgi:hypothetical protein